MAVKGGKLRVVVLGVGRIGKIHSENLATRIPDAAHWASAAGATELTAAVLDVNRVFLTTPHISRLRLKRDV
jgi:hypothetical protein